MKNTIQSKYDGAISICDPLNNEGHGSVSFTEKAGFFSTRTIYQKKTGRTWETIPDDQFYDEAEIIEPGSMSVRKALDTGKYRFLKTYRPMSRDQAIRLFLDGYADHGGMMTVISEALDKAGIAPMEEAVR